MKRSFPLVLFLLASACSSVAPAPAGPEHVVLVGTTDVHGWFAGHVETPQGGGEGVLWGGLPALASYIDVLRAQHPGRVVVVDSGDMWQGTLESNMFEGQAMVRGYNDVGYAAAAVGNHEFDYGPAGPNSIARGPQDELGAVKRNAGIAEFPFLSANMVEKATGQTPAWAKRYTIVRAGAVRLGIIGLSTPDTPNVTMAANVVNLSFTDPVEATVRAAAELREQKVDAIVVIAHMGGRCSDLRNPNDLTGCVPENEANHFLTRLPAGTIDAYFAGHTHSQMRHYINGVPAAQSFPYSREFSTIDLWIDTANDKVTKSEIRMPTMICTFVYEGTEQCDPSKAPAGARLVPKTFGGRTIVANARLARTIDPFLRRVAEKRDEKVGITTAAPFTRTFTGESPLGVLLSDALREYSSSDFAIFNSGGIRSELPARELTYADVFAVSPFDNFPAIVKMTGAEIVETLRLTSTGVRGLMQVSGLRYTIDAAKDNDKPLAERNKIVSVTRADGTPLDPAQVYTVAMPDFIAAGGDNTAPVMTKIPSDRINVSYARPIRDVFVEVVSKKQQPIAPRVEGRITVLNLPPA